MESKEHVYIKYLANKDGNKTQATYTNFTHKFKFFQSPIF